MRRMNGDRREERGVSYVMVLFTISVLGTLCLSFTVMTGFQREIAANYVSSEQAHYLARAGLNVAVWRMLNEPGFLGLHHDELITFALGEMSVTYMVHQAEYNGNVLATSTGSVENATTILRHLLSPANGGGGPIIDPTLIGWWKLDENTGLAADDSSRYNNDGTLGNMVGNEWAPGQVDSGLEFDGSDDYVDTPIMSDEVANLTFTAWFKSDDAGSIGDDYVAQRIITQARSVSNSRLAIGINNNRIAAYWYDVGHNVGEGTTALTAGVWYHVALTYDGTTVTIYLNGEEENSFPESSMTAPSADTTIKIARHTDGSRDFDGVLDDVRVYMRALTGDEIALVHAGGGVLYREFTEAKADPAGASLTIQTPGNTSEDNLLIAAVATDGNTSLSLAPPGGEGWTAINVGEYSDDVTLGIWWKLAGASESSSHQFTWSGAKQAYGWMMRFIGHDTGSPIDDTATEGMTDISPSSPEVTTSVNDALVLRLGAFDDNDITVDDPGLAGHTAITMDASGTDLLVYEAFTETKVNSSATSVTIATPGAGLVGHWKLDEPSGLTASDSAGSNDGSLTNMVGDEWTTGQVDGGLEFDGDNDHIAGLGGCPTGNFTVACWAIDTGGSGWKVLYSAEQEIWLGVDSGASPKLYIDVGGNGNGANTVGGTWTQDIWHHIAGTWDGTAVHLYIDGIDMPITTYGTPENPVAKAAVIGAWSKFIADENWFGTIDDMRLYSRALDAGEITELAAGSSMSGLSEGDLLVAAVATDGDTSMSLSPPGGEGWTEIDVTDYSNEVTLGAWWKLAGAAESLSHQFTWSGGQQAYGWMMHFTGHDPSAPIDVYATAGETGSTPTSPSVSTTVEDAIILRLGAFDDSDVTEDAPGLGGHTAITMDASGPGGSQVTYHDDVEEAKEGSGGALLTINTPAGTSENDLLIAAVSTDGGTSASLAPPVGEGWAEIDLNDQSGAMTLGVWWKLADAAESPSHQFTWSGSQKAYGWIMRFTGHDQADPINVSGAGGATADTPDCPSVTTTVANTTILRIGGFDDDDVNVDNTGLFGYTEITMDESDSGPGSCSGGAGYVLQPAIGDTGIAEFQLTASEQYRAVTVAIAPAAGAGSSTVSGGAGYVAQSSIGASGMSDFALTASEEAQMLTVAIAPDPANAPVSGGAGYVKQPSSGASGTSTFSLTASEEARMVTIAITPAGP